MSDMYVFIYKCRLCSEQFQGAHGNKKIIHEAITHIVITGETYLDAGIPIIATGYHTCDNGGREFTSHRWECPHCNFNSCIKSKAHTPHYHCPGCNFLIDECICEPLKC